MFFGILLGTISIDGGGFYRGLGHAPLKWKSITFLESLKENKNILLPVFIILLIGIPIVWKKMLRKQTKLENKTQTHFEDIYIPLSDNESYRPVPAICITETMYKLQGEELYKQLHEEWQFLPGDTVLVERQHIGSLYCLVAVEKVTENDYLSHSNEK
jgi:hypothetical protein